MEIKPEKTPREKLGWKLMMAGFFCVVLAGILLYVGPRSAHPTLYSKIGYDVMVGGLLVYVVGRILRWRGRSARSK